MMNSNEIRQSFLDFFKERGHTILPSASLVPESPNLLFTNAGMNPFVPFFLGKQKCPYDPPRIADSQKCLRAGGKHNDLEEVGYDTYHHTFFEMLGNWSFNDYFKEEAIHWAWELLTQKWGFPKERIYATVYKPAPDEPGEFDEEAFRIWFKIFQKAKLNPLLHIHFGTKKDNFWMMGETGPCGPCSEIHIDLTPDGQSEGKLINKNSPLCIEIWNLVFIQLNANEDGSFSLLPSRHVDTGMGLERVCAIIQGTSSFRQFNRTISDYDTDLFIPLIEKLQDISKVSYTGSIPPTPDYALDPQLKKDVAFRVIVDHVRALAFAIADGILPSNLGRGHVLRRLLRRAIRFGQILGVNPPFLFEMIDSLVKIMGSHYPELIDKQGHIEEVIRSEEELFARTLSHGLALFEEIKQKMIAEKRKEISGKEAFVLYDTYGFPLDLTQLLAKEQGFSVDTQGFERLMAEQRKRSLLSHEEDIVSLTKTSQFVGYEELEAEAEVVVLLSANRAIFDRTPFYAEMGGQVGDRGYVIFDQKKIEVLDTIKSASGAHVHRLAFTDDLKPGSRVYLQVDKKRRQCIAAHHTATHILHWALRKVLGPDTLQRGSYVGPDRLRFDFSHTGPLSAKELAEIERLVNEKIELNDPVTTEEESYEKVKNNPDILQLFGEKYGQRVRIVSVGHYSKELCGGTHVRSTGEIGYFKILGEYGVSAGIRRIEAACGKALEQFLHAQAAEQDKKWQILHSKDPSLPELSKWVDALDLDSLIEIFHKRNEELSSFEKEIKEKEKLKAKKQEENFRREASQQAKAAIAQVEKIGAIPVLFLDCDAKPQSYLPLLWNEISKRIDSVAILTSRSDGKINLFIGVGPSLTEKIEARNLLSQLIASFEGKGGGSKTIAQGGLKDSIEISSLFEKGRRILEQYGGQKGQTEPKATG
ncbi:alanine--tRNA ligase [Candidatus Methylacidiphilum infernorum]|uniref:Alanine--tRNA ligase n=2 Tax=Candidatus Methylacidiphilum infernorum TaxID=511746 RepID=A0ABX7PU06_9BACT|nr:alanine--tRNA ligase [Candidatus Methylacidiphilum infernorum]